MKRFYKDIGVVERGGVFDVLLDGKAIKTPRRKTLSLPTQALADAIAVEWQGQGDEIQLHQMPLNRLANAAIDRAGGEREQVVADVLLYASSDLLCYRAEDAVLAARQHAGWDPILEWLKEEHHAPLRVTTGMIHVAQPSESVLRLSRAVQSRDTYALTSLHAAATITGSLALALAMVDGRLDAAEAFALSRLDETYQAEKWGEDRPAIDRANTLARELAFSARFAALSRP